MSTGEEIFLHYKGPVLYDTIGLLISQLKELMFEKQVKQSIYKKVLMIMIESLENVFKYHEYFETEASIMEKHPPELLIKRNNSKFLVQCSNPIRKTDVLGLRNRLEFINSLDKAGVKELYKQTITNGHFSEKGGAGLGLIEMVKISDSNLHYNFDDITDKFSYYTMKLILNRE